MSAERRPVVCTAIPRSHLPYARLLGRSLVAQGAERLIALVVDDIGGDRRDEEHVVYMSADDLPVGTNFICELALCVEGDDLAACLVPAMLAELLRREGDRSVIYLAADTVVCGPLDELGELARAHGVVLLPRLLSPLPRDGRQPTEKTLTDLGVYDPGCVAVAHGAESFLKWWEFALDALASEEDAHPARAQRVLDLVPEVFSACVLSDPRFGIAYWNAHERVLRSGSSGELLVGNLAARTVHLVDFDLQRPTLFSASESHRPRVLLSEYAALGALCAEFAGAISDDVEGPHERESRFSELTDGTPLDERMRRAVRAARRQRPLDDAAVPNPFSKESLADFYAWLATGDVDDPLTPMLPRYLREVVADRLDLRWSFPRIGTVDAPRFREWAENHGFDEEDLPLGLRSAIEESRWWRAPSGVMVDPPERLQPGVTFAGYLRTSVGVGEAGRLVLDALQRSGVEVSPVVLGRKLATRQDEIDRFGVHADRMTNIVWMNADQLPGFASVVGPQFFEGRYSVGGWVWETERLPQEMAKSAELVDEIWVPSEFVHAAVSAGVDRPVFNFPYPVLEPPHASTFNPMSLSVPPGFTFLFAFDFLSSFRRKNPLGLLEAYCRAFRADDGAVLVLKCVNGEQRLDELEELRLKSAGRRDVVVVNQKMAGPTQAALLVACDCYVSLHRSEGFGLSLAEAMLLGKPVVATGYSGNLEFMDETCAYLVPSTLVPIGPGAFPYAAHDRWADPDLDTAAATLRRVFEAKKEAAEIAERGRTRALEVFAPARSEAFLTGRIGEIERLRRAGYASTTAGAVRQLA